jgi:hypothetical protein
MFFFSLWDICLTLEYPAMRLRVLVPLPRWLAKVSLGRRSPELGARMRHGVNTRFYLSSDITVILYFSIHPWCP